MTERNFRWFVRFIDITALQWFTVWLFWIDKPIWKWVFLALAILNTVGMVQQREKDDKKLEGR
jgi:hypothetical protein